MEKALVSWSSGKDSAMALHQIANEGRYQPVALLTTVSAEYDRVSMHGVRRSLLEAQAAALGLDLEIVWLPKDASNEVCESKIAETLAKYREQGVTTVVFGDIFLQELRAYREARLAEVGLKGCFPLWARDTHELANTLVGLGFKALTTCVDGEVLGPQFVGRAVDAAFLTELPDGVDWCGENGEYHSVVVSGPLFSAPIPYRLGEIVLRDERFHYCDVLANRDT